MADQATVDTGGQITINDGFTLSIPDGTGTDLTVNGKIQANGRLSVSSGGAQLRRRAGQRPDRDRRHGERRRERDRHRHPRPDDAQLRRHPHVSSARDHMSQAGGSGSMRGILVVGNGATATNQRNPHPRTRHTTVQSGGGSRPERRHADPGTAPGAAPPCRAGPGQHGQRDGNVRGERRHRIRRDRQRARQRNRSRSLAPGDHGQLGRNALARAEREDERRRRLHPQLGGEPQDRLDRRNHRRRARPETSRTPAHGRSTSAATTPTTTTLPRRRSRATACPCESTSLRSTTPPASR